jgi:membrane-bound lytic murein transglycosylase B
MPDFNDTARPRLATLMTPFLATSLIISGCVNAPQFTPTASTPSLDTRLSLPPTTPGSPSSAPVESATISSPVADAAALTIRPLPGSRDANSYADRLDALALAQDIAKEMSIDASWTWKAVSQARYKESVAKLIMPAPAATGKNWALYRSRFVEPIRIKAGVAFWRAHEAELRRAESIYGVPAEIIAGIIGVETIYGRQTGQFRVLDVLTTLSLDFPKGRSDRSDFFKQELAQFLKLCVEQGAEPESVLGSYAGAIGLPQFMPSSVRRYAVDFDGDGRIDLQRSVADAIGSVGHYLSQQGWKTNQPSYFEITPPADPNALSKLLAPDIVPSFPAQDMVGMGAKLPDAAMDYPGPLALVQLFNAGDPPTMIAGTANFYAITRYNQSSYYALAVVQLGQAVAREMTRQTKP